MLLALRPSAVTMLFPDVRDHVDEEGVHVLIRNLVENMPRLPHPFDKPGASKKPKMMADERLRQVEIIRDLRDGFGYVRAVEQNPKPAGITQQAKGLRKADQFVMRQRFAPGH